MKQYKKGIALTVGLAALLGAVFTYDAWHAEQRESPHYVDRACGVCHQPGSHMCTPTDCVVCHVPNDVLKPLKTDELTLCTACHTQEDDVNVPNENGKVITVALGRSHPWGLVPSAASEPSTLPLVDGKLTCQTCHDVHRSNESSRMLRLGSDSDFTPLCHDCHSSY